MTLVVFQKKDDVISLCSDMKMSWDAGLQTPKHIYGWRPKTVIVNDDLAVSWAGELAFADKAFLKIWSVWKDFQIKDILDILIKYNQESMRRNNETEFLLTQRYGDCYKISSNYLYNITNIAIDFIGNEDLYKKFSAQKEGYHSNNTRLSISRIGEADGRANEVIAKITNKMRNISELYSDSDLGHVIVPVSGDGKQVFNYYMTVHIDALPTEINQNDGKTIINLGDIDSGGYAYQIKSLKYEGHTILIYENMYNQKNYFFSDYSKGVPVIEKNQNLIAP